jgi:hypothetical protein
MSKNVWPDNHEYVYISIIQYVHLGKSGRKQYSDGIPWPSEGFFLPTFNRNDHNNFCVRQTCQHCQVDEGGMYKTVQGNEKKIKIEHYYDCWHVAKSKTLLVTN